MMESITTSISEDDREYIRGKGMTVSSVLALGIMELRRRENAYPFTERISELESEVKTLKRELSFIRDFIMKGRQ